jgi:hypothetical protein
MMEADGVDPDETADIYIKAGQQMTDALVGGAYDDTNLRKLAALIDYFTKARASRVLFAAGNRDGLAQKVGSNSYWCRETEGEVCPGSLSTYSAIKLYLDRHYVEAGTTALSALERPQPWTTASPYEHPLLWLLAASARRGDADEVEAHGALIDSALAAWPEDARVALLLLVEPDRRTDADTLAACTSAGCRYFLAQAHLIAGDREAGNGAIAEGLALCEDIRSIPCAALHSAQADIDAGAAS